MEMYTIYDLANHLDKSIFTVKKYVSEGKLPGRKLGGTWITTDRELRQYINGKPLDEIFLSELFDVKGAAHYLDVDISVIRRLQKAKRLKGQQIDQRGHNPSGGTVAFTARQLNAAEPFAASFVERKSGRPITGNVDQYIKANQTTDDMTFFSILGTHNINYDNYSYKNLPQARKRARKAYNAPLVYEKDDAVQIYVSTWDEGDRVHNACIMHDVTPICRTVRVKITETGRHDGVEIILQIDKEIMGKRFVVST